MPCGCCTNSAGWTLFAILSLRPALCFAESCTSSAGKRLLGSASAVLVRRGFCGSRSFCGFSAVFPAGRCPRSGKVGLLIALESKRSPDWTRPNPGRSFQWARPSSLASGALRSQVMQPGSRGRVCSSRGLQFEESAVLWLELQTLLFRRERRPDRPTSSQDDVGRGSAGSGREFCK